MTKADIFTKVIMWDSQNRMLKSEYTDAVKSTRTYSKTENQSDFLRDKKNEDGTELDARDGKIAEFHTASGLRKLGFNPTSPDCGVHGVKNKKWDDLIIEYQGRKINISVKSSTDVTRGMGGKPIFILKSGEWVFCKNHRDKNEDELIPTYMASNELNSWTFQHDRDELFKGHDHEFNTVIFFVALKKTGMLDPVETIVASAPAHLIMHLFKRKYMNNDEEKWIIYEKDLREFAKNFQNS